MSAGYERGVSAASRFFVDPVNTVRSQQLTVRDAGSAIGLMMPAEIDDETEIRFTLGAMCLFRQEVQAWMAQWRRAQDADISITDAARALGLKEQVAFELVRTDLLKSRPSLNGSMRRIPLHELESFKVC
jgi:hypothetical protein